MAEHPNAKWLEGMKQLIAFVEANPQNDHFGASCERFIAFSLTKEELLARTKNIGPLEKIWKDKYFSLRKTFAGGIVIDFMIDRDQVCERIVTKKVIPARPELVLPATPEREVEEVEWHCPDSLLAKTE